MTAVSESANEGGETPCFAHLVNQPLAVSDALLAGLARDLADAVVIADAGGTIVFWNSAAERVFGWSTGEAVGQSLDLIIPERHRDRHWTGYRRTMATGETKYGDQLLEVPALHRERQPGALDAWVVRRRLDEVNEVGDGVAEASMEERSAVADLLRDALADVGVDARAFRAG